MASISWAAQGAWEILRIGIEIGVRGIRRCLTQDDDEEALATRLILDPDTHRPRAIEERLGSRDGPIKRRRISEIGSEYDVPSGMRHGSAIGNGSQSFPTNRHAGRSRRSPNSPTNYETMKSQPRQHLGPSLSRHNIQSQRRQPRSPTLSYQRQTSYNQNYSAQHDNASMDFIAGIQWDGGFPTSQSNHNQYKMASGDPTAGINLPNSPKSRIRAIVAAKNREFKPKVPGAEQYSSKYDLITKPRSAELPLYTQIGPIRSPKTNLRQHPYRKVESKKKHASFVSENDHSSPESEKIQTTSVSKKKQSAYRYPFDVIKEEEKEYERQVAHEKRIEEEMIAKEKKSAEDEQNRIALALFKNESLGSENKADKATLKARADAREAAAAKLRKQAAIGHAEKEEEVRREYEERTAMVEKEDVALPDGMAFHNRPKKVQRSLGAHDRAKKVQRTPGAASFGKLWSPNPLDAMLTARNTSLNSRLTGHHVYSPEVKTTEPEKAVHIALSPNTGLEAVQHKVFDKTEPPTQLNLPEGPWPRREPFFVRSFDSLLRLPDGSNPSEVTTGEPWGLPPRTVGEGTIPKAVKAVDNPVEMTDAPDVSDEPIPTTDIPTTPSLVDDTGSSTPSKSSSPESAAAGSTQTYMRPCVSDENSDIIDISIDERLSQISLHKVEAVRSDRRAAAEKVQREKEEAKEKARAEAAEAARKKAEDERKKAEEKAKALEAKRLARGGRRMPTEPLIKPVDKSWEARFGEILRLANARLANGKANGPIRDTVIVPKGPAGTEILAKDFGTVLNGTAWLNDEIINQYLALLCKELNAAAGAVKYGCQTSFFYSKLRDEGVQKVERWLRKYQAIGDKLLKLDYIFIPVNNMSHWTLLVVSPKHKTIEYLDSFHGDSTDFVTNTRLWLADQLKGKYVASEWTVQQTRCTTQPNGYDCGVFTVTNAKCIALGVDTTCYAARDMAIMRERIAAELFEGASLP